MRMKLIRFFPWLLSWYETLSLILPFRKIVSGYLGDQFLLLEKTSNYLSVNLAIGTPPQHLSVNWEFYSTTLWWWDQDCSDIYLSKTNPQIPFKTEMSSSYHNKSKTRYTFNMKRYVDVVEAIDTAVISDNVKVNDFEFFVAKRFTDLGTNSGVWGWDLNNRSFSKLAFLGFLPQWKRNNNINSTVFFIQYTDDKEGDLHIGSYPSWGKDYKYVNDTVYFNQWALRFDNVYYDSPRTVFAKAPVVYFQIELGVIVGSTSYYTFITNNFFENAANAEICKSIEIHGTRYNTFKCDKNAFKAKEFPEWSFQIQQHYIVLTYKDLFFDCENNNLCFAVVISDFSTVKNNNDWIVGEPFFKKEIIVFDDENKSIGFYYTDEKRMKFNGRWYGIVFGVIAGVWICVYVGVVVLRKKKRIDKKNRNKGLIPGESEIGLVNVD